MQSCILNTVNISNLGKCARAYTYKTTNLKSRHTSFLSICNCFYYLQRIICAYFWPSKHARWHLIHDSIQGTGYPYSYAWPLQQWLLKESAECRRVQNAEIFYTAVVAASGLVQQFIFLSFNTDFQWATVHNNWAIIMQYAFYMHLCALWES